MEVYDLTVCLIDSVFLYAHGFTFSYLFPHHLTVDPYSAL